LYFEFRAANGEEKLRSFTPGFGARLMASLISLLLSAAGLVNCRANAKRGSAQSARFQWFGFCQKRAWCFRAGNRFGLEHAASRIEPAAGGAKVLDDACLSAFVGDWKSVCGMI
jgi:hypothetical protein